MGSNATDTDLEVHKNYIEKQLKRQIKMAKMQTGEGQNTTSDDNGTMELSEDVLNKLRMQYGLDKSVLHRSWFHKNRDSRGNQIIWSLCARSWFIHRWAAHKKDRFASLSRGNGCFASNI